MTRARTPSSGDNLFPTVRVGETPRKKKKTAKIRKREGGSSGPESGGGGRARTSPNLSVLSGPKICDLPISRLFGDKTRAASVTVEIIWTLCLKTHEEGSQRGLAVQTAPRVKLASRELRMKGDESVLHL